MNEIPEVVQSWIGKRRHEEVGEFDVERGFVLTGCSSVENGNPLYWDEDIARVIASEEDIELNDDHWAIIYFMRAQQEEHGVSPDARHAFSFLAERKGVSKREARDMFFKLFPYGYVKQACKIAGMVQPRAWSTG